MKYSYNWLKELVPKLPKPEKLAEAIGLHAFEVEGIEKFGNDYILDIGVLPNRMPDAAGYIGMAREIAAILNIQVKIPNAIFKESAKKKTRDILQVEVKDPRLCPRYMARVVSNVVVKESPVWLRKRIEACGLRSINNIVDVTNYVMLETGQPLHAFDFEGVEGAGGKKKIIVRCATEKETIELLDGDPYTLTSSMLVVSDPAGPLDIAGIRGGKRAGITPHTNAIILMAASFHGPSIRATSQKLKLRTDASARYSTGLSTVLPEEAMNRACMLISQITKSTIYKGGIDVYPYKEQPYSIKVRPEYVSSLLGVDISVKEIFSTLKRLGCSIKKTGDILLVKPPIERQDLCIEEDIIEEVGRIYGYSNIIPVEPLAELGAPRSERNEEYFWEERVRDILSGTGFQETYGYSFIGEEDLRVFGEDPKEYLLLKNPISSEFSYMRGSLAYGLLRQAGENLKHDQGFQMFEIGRVFGVARHTKETHHERSHAGGIIAYKNRSHSAEAFFELKGALSVLFDRLGIEVWFDNVPSPAVNVFHPYRAAVIKIGEDTIGLMGEVHSRLARHYGIEGEVALFEMDMHRVAKEIEQEKEFRPVSRYPAVTRDISLLVPVDTRMVEVLDVIENTGGELLIDTDLADMYAGPELPDGKKNFLFRLVFQAKDRTLVGEEVDNLMNTITSALQETNLEWEVR